MAILVATHNPRSLLSAIKAKIDSGKVDTWGYDSDGDFTHSPAQWQDKAWLKPSIASGTLTFGLIGRKEVAMGKEVYAIYHGRFIEMLLAHFDDSFSSAQATAQSAPSDLFK